MSYKKWSLMHCSVMLTGSIPNTRFIRTMQVASAYGHEPVATTSLLAYVLCHDLHPTLEDKVAWLGVLGTFGDLGSSVKWQDPFPDMTAAIKQHGGKTKFSQAVSLLNARELHV